MHDTSHQPQSFQNKSYFRKFHCSLDHYSRLVQPVRFKNKTSRYNNSKFLHPSLPRKTLLSSEPIEKKNSPVIGVCLSIAITKGRRKARSSFGQGPRRPWRARHPACRLARKESRPRSHSPRAHDARRRARLCGQCARPCATFA